MTKFKTIILALCLTIGASLCYANHADYKKADGTPITIIKSTNFSGVDRTSSISASINGHTLTVAFTEYLGDVTIEVNDITGSPVDLTLVGTPIGYECYIPLTGHYTVYFKLANGDEYSGEFDVTD